MKNINKISHGGCLCGAIRFEVKGPLRDIVNCHCEMCLRLHGGFGPYTKAQKSNLKISKEKGLIWYQSSPIAQRGFCQICGSNLFWKPLDQNTIAIVAGSLDQPTDLKTMGHIFVAEKADFYQIHDDLPQFAGSSNGKLPDDYK